MGKKEDRMFVLVREEHSGIHGSENIIVGCLAENPKEATKQLEVEIQQAWGEKSWLVTMPEKAPKWFVVKDKRKQKKGWQIWRKSGHVSIQLRFVLQEVPKTFVTVLY
ncbi:hypothetical protein KJ885_02625 [Patescibacteria group bacterium]|nr:hypothetical protein [Patescibacteria group bacterium]